MCFNLKKYFYKVNIKKKNMMDQLQKLWKDP